MLSCEHVRAGYPGREVLHDVSLSVGPGESVALLGHNGSGKTTLLRVLGGQLAPAAGRVLLDGGNPATLSPRERARRIAVVPQRAEFFATQIVRDMVLLGRYAHLGWWGTYAPRDYHVADQALASAGAQELARRRMGELSGGEVQRVMLARALAQESRLLLLDELAAALDWARVVELFDLLQNFFYMAMGRKAVDLVPLSADDIQTLGADRAGRAQQRNFFRHNSFLPVRRRTRR